RPQIYRSHHGSGCGARNRNEPCDGPTATSVCRRAAAEIAGLKRGEAFCPAPCRFQAPIGGAMVRGLCEPGFEGGLVFSGPLTRLTPEPIGGFVLQYIGALAQRFALPAHAGPPCGLFAP